MMEIDGESITVLLKIIFERKEVTIYIYICRKKANIVPIHKKEDKKLVEICSPSLVKFMKALSLVPSSIISKAIDFLHLLNQVFC